MIIWCSESQSHYPDHNFCVVELFVGDNASIQVLHGVSQRERRSERIICPSELGLLYALEDLGEKTSLEGIAGTYWRE